MAAVGDNKLRGDADLGGETVCVTARAPHDQDAVAVTAPLDQHPGRIEEWLATRCDNQLAVYRCGVVACLISGSDNAKSDLIRPSLLNW